MALRLREPDFRMRDNELVLRYLAYRHNAKRYNGNLKWFLDQTTNEFNRDWNTSESLVNRYYEDLNRSIQTTIGIFGGDAFKKWNGWSYETRLNRAVFDVMSYFFSFEDVAVAATAAASDVREAFEALCEDNTNFVQSITSTTKSVEAVAVRFETWQGVLQEIIGSPIAFPRES